jgi:SNF2 family DNA or RNA helicase
MLREEQIDLRRQRARQGGFRIENLGKNRVFSDYLVTNPATGGQYQVSIRGFEVGDNTCSCPDYRSNTLGTCKHVEAVLESARGDLPPHLQQRKAAITRPEIFLHYGEQLRLGLHLPPRHSDQLGHLATRFFDSDGYFKPAGKYDDLIAAVETVPESVTIFSDAMDFMDRETERRALAERERELLAQLDAGETPPALENLLRVPLYEYQLRGAVFAACRGRSILGDDMGLGKTVQTMAAVELLARERGISRVLVVAPASVKYQWEAEVRKFTGRPAQVIEGGAKARRRQYAQETFYRLVNYEQVLKDLDELNQWQPDLIVLDEAQRIKNWESKVSRAVKKLRSRHALVLTGTPLENKLEELYSIVQFVDDRRLGPAFQFLAEHRITDDKGNLLGYRQLDKVRERLAPILLRRTRAEVLSQLPPRTDTTRFVEMAEAQRGPYDEQYTALARLVGKKVLTDLDRKRILCCLANLRMLCNSTYLFDKATNVSPKLDEFAELMGELAAEGGHKAVVFSQWELMLQKAAEVLSARGIGFEVLHGRIPGRDRKRILERFRDDDACRVLLSTDTGGTGLNLQVADTVVNLEVPWNPAVLEQRVARAHRMGQERPVRVIQLVTRNSIEERVLQTLERKRTLFAGVFAGDADEVEFEAAGRSAFLEAVRELVGVAEPVVEPPASREPVASRERERPEVVEVAAPAVDGPAALLAAGVQMLEALVAWAQAAPLPPELAARAAAAARALLEALGGQGDRGPA